jgi:hypothetical protein
MDLDAGCGYARTPSDCPLANYLDARNGLPHGSASVSTASYALTAECFPLPDWARRFVCAIDILGRRSTLRVVRVREALRLLDAVCTRSEGRVMRVREVLRLLEAASTRSEDEEGLTSSRKARGARWA